MRPLWLLAACFLWAAPGRAESRASLEVQRGPGAESCADATELAGKVRALEERATLLPGAAGSQALHFRVTLEREPEHWRARIEVSGTSRGERTITDSGATCAGLGDAVALTLAMLSEPAEPEPAPVEPAPPPPAVVPPEPLRPIARARPRERDFSLGASAGAVLAAGLLDRAGFGATGEIDVGTRSFRAGLGVLWAVPQSIDHGPGSVDVSLIALTLALCVDLAGRDGGIEIAACATQAAGEIRGAGRGYDAYTRSVGRPWLALGAGARAGGPIVGPLGWSAGALLLAPLTDEEFTVEGVSGVAYEPAPLAVVSGVGLRLSIW